MLKIVNYNKEELSELVIMQLRNWYAIYEKESISINNILDSVLEKIDFCFSKIANKYYYSPEQGGERY